jgi:cytochrome bd ubiquinol oxidase subunit I
MELLARIQFAVTASFHYIYPPLSIGLGLLLVLMEGLYLITGKPLFHQMTRFWVSIFFLIFGIGVATGLVMEFEFGTNWASYSRYVGDIFGSALAAEGLFAFFLESGFLGVLVFGWDKVSKGMHFFATLMVALGSTFSAVWIVIANSWQQTPVGYHIMMHNGLPRAEITDFWAMVFNPSSMQRLSHVISGAWLAGATLVLSVSAYYLLRKRHREMATVGIKIALCVATLASLLQLGTGHWSAIEVAQYQPAKMAAMEGLYKTQAAAPLSVAGWVDEKNERVRGLEIPGLLSYMIYFDVNKPVAGLDQFAKDLRPAVQPVFQTYHLMVAIGMGLIGIMGLGWVAWWRGSLFNPDTKEGKVVLSLMVLSVFGPQLANQAGWFTAEMGRQPWIVYGLLRTSAGLSKMVTANQVLSSLILFTLIYALLFSLFIFLLNQKIQKGPHSTPDGLDDGSTGHKLHLTEA